MTHYTTNGAPTVRALPHNDEAERGVLGAVFIDAAALDVVEVATLTPGDFYRENHRHIWRAMRALHDAGTPIDVLTLADHLERAGLLGTIGGPAFLSRLSSSVPSIANADQYARIVARDAARREAIQTLAHATDDLHAGEDVRAELERVSERLGASERNAGPRLIGELSVALTEDMDRRHRSGDRVVGVSTGWPSLDALFGAGTKPGELIVIGARPGMGKSAVGLAMAANAAAAGVPVYMASYEMLAPQIALRHMAALTGVRTAAARELRMSDVEWDRWIAALSGPRMGDPLWIEETAGVQLHVLIARVRQMVRDHGVGLVVVDYLQQVPVRGCRDRGEEVTRCSNALAAVAKELSIGIIALAQLNREADKRSDKRPSKSDLRASGEIEQDADVVALLYRDAYYNPNHTGPDVVEVIVDKARSGQTGTAHLELDMACGRLTECEAPAPPAHEAGEKKQQYQSW